MTQPIIPATLPRDRDRLRQQQLEKLDWRYLVDMRKEEEVERAMEAYHSAVAPFSAEWPEAITGLQPSKNGT